MPRNSGNKIAVKRVYTTGDIAAVFHVSHRCVVNMLERGVVPFYRLPSGWRSRLVLHEDLMKLLTSDPAYYPLLKQFDWERAPADLAPEEWIKKLRPEW